MKKMIKQFFCLMFTAHSASEITSDTWDIPTVAQCQRFDQDVSREVTTMDICQCTSHPCPHEEQADKRPNNPETGR